jgi:anti-sigma B factor antagonist
VNAASSAVEISGDLTVQVAAEWKVQLIAALEAGPELRIELAQVIELDTAGLQLLLMIHREAAAAGKELTLTGHSRAVLDVLALAHLNPDLSDVSVLGGSPPVEGLR